MIYLSPEEDSSQKSNLKRHVASHTPISFILNGRFIKGEEEFASSYIELGIKKVSRVDIIAIVVSLEGSNSFVIEDGSGKISVRRFDQVDNKVTIGDIVNIIGRPREFNQERYIVPEIIKKTNETWMRVRKKELEKDFPELPKENIEEEIIEQIDFHEKIIMFIKSRDNGSGVASEELIKNIGQAEELIEGMMKEGEIFENMPGRLKVLE